jgi:hypothetical protein
MNYPLLLVVVAVSAISILPALAPMPRPPAEIAARPAALPQPSQDVVFPAPVETSVAAPRASTGQSAGTRPAACNVDACAAAYRTFRESDCSYVPSFGQRKLCAK